jgi:predicted phosphate transport protein (TIGR00153 family)
VKLRLIPREENFFELFCEQAETIVEAADLLLDITRDYKELHHKVLQMNKIEHKADEIAHRIVERLNLTFITPIDSEDIHSLSSAIDDIVDYIDATVERLVLYKVTKPTADFEHLANILHRAADETRAAVTELGVFKKKPNTIKQCWIEINRLENEGDTASRAAIAKLFENESNAVEVIKWKEIYEHLEMAIDKCEDVANILEQIVLKHS